VRAKIGLVVSGVLVLVFLAIGTATAAADTVNLALSTSSPVRGIPVSVAFSGADAPFNASGNTPFLYALVRPANGIACQPTFGADLQVSGTTNGTQLYNANNNGNTVSSGNYSYSASVTPAAGAYIVCAWLETDSGDDSGRGDTSSVVTAATSASYDVSAPTPTGPPKPTSTPKPTVSCTVPRFAGSSLSRVKRKLLSHHCGIGQVTYVRRRHTHRSEVLGLSAPPGRPASGWVSSRDHRLSRAMTSSSASECRHWAALVRRSAAGITAGHHTHGT
jgi:hypothetical protein